MNFLLHLHPAISFTLVAAVCAALALLGLRIVRGQFKEDDLKDHHEVGGIIFHGFVLIYAVLLAFVVYAAWSSYDTTKRNLDMELNKLADLYADSQAFDKTTKKNIRTAIANYTKAVAEKDWPLMAKGERWSQESKDTYQAVWDVYINADLKAIKNTHMYDESLRQLNSMSEFRRLRYFSSITSTPFVLWYVLVICGIISVVYTFFFRADSLIAQCIMTAAYTVINSMLLFLIYVFDNPFTGHSAISNDMLLRAAESFLKNIGQ